MFKLESQLIKFVLISGAVHAVLLSAVSVPKLPINSQILAARLQGSLPLPSSHDKTRTNQVDLTPGSPPQRRMIPDDLAGDHRGGKVLKYPPDLNVTKQVAQSLESSLVDERRGGGGQTLSELGGGESPSSPIDQSQDEMRNYRIQLAKQARKFKRYPIFARQRELEGVVELVLRYSPASGGRIEISRGSSHEELDAQALEMIRKAYIATELPVVLKKSAFNVVLSVEYRLSEE